MWDQVPVLTRKRRRLSRFGHCRLQSFRETHIFFNSFLTVCLNSTKADIESNKTSNKNKIRMCQSQGNSNPKANVFPYWNCACHRQKNGKRKSSVNRLIWHVMITILHWTNTPSSRTEVFYVVNCNSRNVSWKYSFKIYIYFWVQSN